MYSGLSKKLSCTEFILNLAIMYDILAELSMLSESLKNQETNVYYADKLIRRSMRFLREWRKSLEQKLWKRKLLSGKENPALFHSQKPKKTPTVNHQQLITNVINNMHKILFTRISSHEPCVPSTPSYQAAYKSLLKELKVLEPDHWPCDNPVGWET